MAAFWHAYAVTSHPSLRFTQSYFIRLSSDKTKNEAKKRRKSLIVRFCFRHVIFLSHLSSAYHFGFRMLSALIFAGCTAVVSDVVDDVFAVVVVVVVANTRFGYAFLASRSAFYCYYSSRMGDCVCVRELASARPRQCVSAGIFASVQCGLCRPYCCRWPR